jgi:hypothetical protein
MIHAGRVARFKVDDHVNVVRGGFSHADHFVTEVASDPLLDAGGRITNAGKSAKYRITGYPHWVYDWMLELSA